MGNILQQHLPYTDMGISDPVVFNLLQVCYGNKNRFVSRRKVKSEY
jgi:hypothetical protein